MLELSAQLGEPSGKMLQIMNLKPVFVSFGASLSLCVACGSSDAGGNGRPVGSAGTSQATGGSGNPGGSGNLAGSGLGGASAGGSNPSAAGASATSSGSYSSGLAGDKVLGSLTEAEAAGLCKKLSDYFSDDGPVGKSVEDFSCRFSSALTALFTNPKTDAALQASCASLYATCTAAPTTTTETCSKPDASCTATVAEYDACVNDQLDSLDQLLSSVPACDKLTLASAATFFSGATQATASCETVQAKCPSAPTPPGLDDLASESP